MRVDMYLLRDGAGDLAELACRLVGKAWPSHASVQIICADQPQCQALDRLLWQIPEDRLIAHQLADSQAPEPQPADSAVRAPVTLTMQPETAKVAANSVMVELRELDTVADNCQQFARILDIVSNSEACRARARLRYKAYRQITNELHTHELS